MSTATLNPPNNLPTLTDRRTLGPWYAAEFLNSFAITLYSTCAYFFAEKFLHATPVQCLWLSAGWGFAYVPFALLSGYLTEKWGQRRLILRLSTGCVFTALLGLLIIIFPACQNLWMLFLAMTAVNFTCNQIWPPMESAITRTPGKMRLSTRIALYNLTWSSASFIAFFVVSYVQTLGWYAIFIIPALGFLVSTLIIFGLGIPQKLIGSQEIHNEENAADAPPTDPAQIARARTLLHMAWIGNAMAYVAINVLIPVLPTLVKLSGVTLESTVAVIVSTWALTRFVGFFITWRWSGWHYSVRWMIASYILLMASFTAILALPANIPLLLTAEVVFGLSTALLYFASLYYAMHVSSGGGGHAGIHEALIGLGIGVGPAVGALAGTSGDVTKIDPYTIGAVVGVLFLGLVSLIILGFRAGSKK